MSRSSVAISAAPVTLNVRPQSHRFCVGHDPSTARSSYVRESLEVRRSPNGCDARRSRARNATGRIQATIQAHGSA